MNLAGTNGGRTAIGSGTGSKYFGKPLTEFTLGEIREKQRKGEIHAAGRYQFLGGTIDDVLDRADISPDITMDSKFDRNTQDILAVAYFRRSIKDYAGSDDQVIQGLGQRWIGLQNIPYEEKLRIVKSIQNDPRYQSPGFQGFDVDPNYEAVRQSKYGG
jgi:muramidase (phage lysozyme)